LTNIVYFSHSYRGQDAEINDYFGRLLESEGLTLSLDPPSDSVNSAKLERHLNYSDGMVAVLTRREGGVSPHIMYEITLSLRGRKPVVVFVEDSLPARILPERVLQRRFSRRSYLRQIKEHRQALRVLRSYIGETGQLSYQPATVRRSCLLISRPDLLMEETLTHLQALVSDELLYEPILAPSMLGPDVDSAAWWDLASSIDVAVAVQDAQTDAASAYILGVVKGALRPVIVITGNQDYPYAADVPQEYQPRKVPILDSATLSATIKSEFHLFEEDFLDLPDQAAVGRYAQQLLDLDGYYGARAREKVSEVVMGDKYEVRGQVGAFGPQAQAYNFTQVWSEKADAIDLPTLARELEQLRAQARTEASSPQHDAEIAALGQAQVAAEDRDGPAALSHLAKVGRWALSVAEKLGVGVAVIAIKTAVGL
jgi:hypothetical protein